MPKARIIDEGSGGVYRDGGSASVKPLTEELPKYLYVFNS